MTIDDTHAARLRLPCRSCGGFEAARPTGRHTWHAFTGLDGVRWLPADAPLPENVDACRQADDEPVEGTERMGWFAGPLDIALADDLWLLYRPYLAAIDGWLDHSDLLDATRIVRCRLLDVPVTGPYWAWGRFEISQVVAVAELATRTDISTGALPPVTQNFQRVRRVKSGPWLLVHASTEGDAGEWLLCRDQGDGRVDLVLSGEWGYHYNRWFAGRRCLTAAEERALVDGSRPY